MAKTADPDEELVRRVGQGDPAAIQAMVARKLPRMLMLAQRMLGDAAEAEDVAQEAMLRAWRQAPRWTPGQAKRAERRAAMFDRLDANKDGSISRTEFDAPRAEHVGRGHRGGMHGGAQRMGRNGEGRAPIVITEAEQKASEAFARLDANRDGTLTGEERRAGMQARRAEMREKRHERRQAAPAASPSTPASE